MRASVVLIWTLIVVGCSPPASAPATTTPTVTPSPASAYPPGWITGMCAAYGDLASNPVDLNAGASGQARVAAALIALSKVPDWPAGDKSRDALIDWYQQMSTAFDLNEQDSLAAIDAEIKALDELGVVGHGLDALEAATGERLPCRAEPSPSGS